MSESYLYIFEDGSFGKSNKSPTAEDYRQIADGLLQVFRFKGDVVEIDEQGDAMKVEPCTFFTIKCDDGTFKQCHGAG